jgi:hypothetical protein
MFMHSVSARMTETTQPIRPSAAAIRPANTGCGAQQVGAPGRRSSAAGCGGPQRRWRRRRRAGRVRRVQASSCTPSRCRWRRMSPARCCTTSSATTHTWASAWCSTRRCGLHQGGAIATPACACAGSWRLRGSARDQHAVRVPCCSARLLGMGRQRRALRDGGQRSEVARCE